MTKKVNTKSMTGVTAGAFWLFILALVFGVLSLTTWLIQVGLTGAGADISFWQTMALVAGANLIIGGGSRGANR